MPVLEQYLSMTHSDDTQVLLTQSMCTLSVPARAVGQEKFSGEFCEKYIKIGMTLIETNDDPDVRKCAYNLFGAVATVVKEKCIKIGMTLIETNDDPDVRKCAYNLFG